MSVLYAAVFYAWLIGTAAIAVAAILFACRTAVGFRRRPGWHAAKVFTYFGVAGLASAANPIVNWRLFHHDRERVVATMLEEVSTPVAILLAKYGIPHKVTRGSDFDDWRYLPGPSHVLLRWEEVVFRIQDDRVVAAFIDD